MPRAYDDRPMKGDRGFLDPGVAPLTPAGQALKAVLDRVGADYRVSYAGDHITIVPVADWCRAVAAIAAARGYAVQVEVEPGLVAAILGDTALVLAGEGADALAKTGALASGRYASADPVDDARRALALLSAWDPDFTAPV